MFSQYNILDHLSSDKILREKAQERHLLNKYFPAKYLDYLSNIVGSSQNHMEIQMGLQLMSQLIFETDFMGCDTGGMLKRYAQAYIEKQISSTLKKSYINFISLLIKSLGFFANLNNQIFGSIFGEARNNQIDNFMEKLLITLKNLKNTVQKIRCYEIMRMALGVVIECKYELPNFKKLIQNDKTIQWVIEGDKFTQQMMSQIKLKISRINKISNPTLFIKQFSINIEAASEYIQFLFESNLITQQHIDMILNYFYQKIITPNISSFKMEEIQHVSTIMNIMLERSLNEIYREQFLQQNKLSIKNQKHKPFQITIVFVYKLVEWTFSLLQLAEDNESSLNKILQIIDPFFNSLHTNNSLISSIIQQMENCILIKPSSKLTCYCYYLFGYYYSYIKPYFKFQAIAEQALQDLEKDKFQNQFRFYLLFYLYNVVTRADSVSSSHKLLIKISNFVLKNMNKWMNTDLKYCIRISMCPANVRSVERFVEKQFLNMQKFSENIWSVITLASQQKKVQILNEINEFLLFDKIVSTNFVEDLYMMIGENKDIFEMNYKDASLSVKAEYLKLLSTCILFVDDLQECFDETVHLLQLFDWNKMTEVIEKQNFIQIYQTILYRINKDQIRILHSFVDLFKKLLEENIDEIVTYKKLMVEFLSMNLVKNEFEGIQNQSNEIVSLQSLAILNMINHINEDYCDILEISIMLYPKWMKKFTHLILQVTAKTPQYYRFCYLIEPQPYPVIKIGTIPVKINELKWLILSLLRIFQKRKRTYSRQKVKKNDQNKMIEQFRELTINSDRKTPVRKILSQILPYFQKMTEEKQCWIKNISQTFIYSKVESEYKNQYKKIKILEKMNRVLNQ